MHCRSTGSAPASGPALPDEGAEPSAPLPNIDGQLQAKPVVPKSEPPPDDGIPTLTDAIQSKAGRGRAGQGHVAAVPAARASLAPAATPSPDVAPEEVPPAAREAAVVGPVGTNGVTAEALAHAIQLLATLNTTGRIAGQPQSASGTTPAPREAIAVAPTSVSPSVSQEAGKPLYQYTKRPRKHSIVG
jgi:hypothetical protein